jgi:branched-chain amino acid transport system substrate-binding protein
VATQFSIPYYMLAASQDSLTDPPAPFHFRFGPNNRQDSLAVADLLAAQGFKKVAIINVSVPFGTDGAAAVTAALDRKGIKVLTQQTYDISATDLSPQVTNIKLANPEVLLVWSYPADAARVTRTVKQLGLKAPMIVPRVGLQTTMRKLAGDSADGILVPTTADWSRDDVRKFFDAFNARFKPVQPTPNPLQGYDAGSLAIKVLQDAQVQKALAGSSLLEARKAIRDATERLGNGFKGLQGTAAASYQFSSKQHHGPPDTGWNVFTEVAENGTKLVLPDLSKFKPAR